MLRTLRYGGKVQTALPSVVVPYHDIEGKCQTQHMKENTNTHTLSPLPPSLSLSEVDPVAPISHFQFFCSELERATAFKLCVCVRERE